MKLYVVYCVLYSVVMYDEDYGTPYKEYTIYVLWIVYDSILIDYMNTVLLCRTI